MDVLAWIRDQISEWRSDALGEKSPCLLLCEITFLIYPQAERGEALVLVMLPTE